MSAAVRAGTWQEVRAIEVRRVCGCYHLLLGKHAIKSKAEKLAAKACYQCQLSARKAARTRKKSS